MRSLFTVVLLAAFSGPAFAEVKTQEVDYKFDGITFKGQISYDDSVTGKRPGVLVVHEWWGLNDYAKGRATELAKLGYVAFACDMYGNGQVTTHPKEAQEFATTVRKNADVWRGRAKAAYDVLAKHELVDATKLAAIGYCFGGSTALQLAYTGADLKAVATFHAGLPEPTPEQAKAIKAKILICNGADDTFVSAESINKFKAAVMNGSKEPLQFESYPGTVHSFTVPDADKHMIKGMAYNADADKKSWASMKELFAKAFK